MGDNPIWFTELMTRPVWRFTRVSTLVTTIYNSSGICKCELSNCLESPLESETLENWIGEYFFFFFINERKYCVERLKNAFRRNILIKGTSNYSRSLELFFVEASWSYIVITSN